MSKQSSTPPRPEATGDNDARMRELADHVVDLPGRPIQPWWNRAGVSHRGERWVDIVGGILVFLFAVGWTWSIARAEAAPVPRGMTPAASTITAALTKRDAPTTAYLTEAALNAAVDRAIRSARGTSGKLRAKIQPVPGGITSDTAAESHIEYSQGGEVVPEPKGAGIWNVLLALGGGVRPVDGLSVINMLPFNVKKNGRIGLYYLGNWPGERGATGPKRAPAGAYGNPAGFIEVTRENANTPVSEHFKLADFLTHDQPNVWPKYLVLQPKLVDKLELVLSDLQAHGVDVSGVRVMSGFRTPQYNVGGGNTGGRAGLSRHMFGDASDIYIDSNHDGQMDDLNHDGKISIEDSKVIAAAVDRVEAAHPELIGGAGVYTAAPGHGPFIHIDTRGYRARWMGTSGG